MNQNKSTELLVLPDEANTTGVVDVTAVTRLKHAELWRACKSFARGRYGGQSGLARHLGVDIGEFGMWVNLKSCPPKLPTRAWTQDRLDKLEAQLIELTGQTLEQLFPDELRSSIAFLQSPKVYEQTATVRADAMRRYAIATADRMRLSASPSLPVEREEQSADIQSAIHFALESLSYRERNVICMRYGLVDGQQMSLEQIAQAFRVSRERIRQIEAQAIRKLQRSCPLAESLNDYIDSN